MQKLLQLAILFLCCASAFAPRLTPVDINRLTSQQLEEFQEFVQERGALHFRESMFGFVAWPDKGINVLVNLHNGRHPALGGFKRHVPWKGLFTDLSVHRLLESVEEQLVHISPSPEEQHLFRDQLMYLLDRRRSESMPRIIRYAVNSLIAKSPVVDRETIRAVKQNIRVLVDRKYGEGSYDTA